MRGGQIKVWFVVEIDKSDGKTNNTDGLVQDCGICSPVNRHNMSQRWHIAS